jgi:putative ABC transport system permease protein
VEGCTLETFWQDVRFALRTLASHPGLTAVALLTLALGIGANTAMFSVVDGVLLKPLPLPQPDEVQVVWAKIESKGYPRFTVSPPDFVDWKAQAKSFEALAAVDADRLNLTGEGEPEVLAVGKVSADFFRVIALPFPLGRGFSPAEDVPGKGQVAVLSHALWQRRFGSDPRIVGKAVRLDGVSHTVVGVAPAGFDLPNDRDLWVPLALENDPSQRGAHYLVVFGRLKDGVTTAQATAEMAGIAGRLEKQFPDTNTGVSAYAVPLQENTVQNIRQALLVLLAAVAAVLLIACLNVANLLLARLTARSRELALRTALGAGRSRLMRQLLTESLVLALGGGVLGAALAVWGTRLLVAMNADNIPRAETIGIDGRVLAFTLALSLGTGLLFGLFPALQRPERDLHASLKEGGRGLSGSGGAKLARQGLVLAEIALALVLLVGAGLLLRSFATLHGVDPGFRSGGVLTLEVAPPQFKYPDEAQQAAFYERLLARLAALPGVEHAASALPLPLDGNGFMLTYQIEGRPAAAPGQEPVAAIRVVSPDFFQALGVPVVRGRAFTAEDRIDSEPVAVVNRAFVERELKGQDPLGKRLTFEDAADPTARWLTIVGVAGDVRHRALSQDPAAEVYWAQLQSPQRGSTVVVQTAGDPASLAPAVRAAVGEIDADLPVNRVRTLDEVVAESLASSRFNAVLFALFAGLALALAAVGVYGVVSYAVAQRTHEIGVRMALGAGRREVVGMILRQGMGTVLWGVAVGLVGAYFAARLLAGLVYGVSPHDLPTFVAVALALAGVALLANVVPARRATRVDPLLALRRD